jgi:hypothetical protein
MNVKLSLEYTDLDHFLFSSNYTSFFIWQMLNSAPEALFKPLNSNYTSFFISFYKRNYENVWSQRIGNWNVQLFE